MLIIHMHNTLAEHLLKAQLGALGVIRWRQIKFLFICEGMYGGNDKDDKAKENKHMTMNEAANIAKAANVKEMWLTHYSPSLPKPQEYKAEIRKIFPNTKVAKDGRSVTLVFED